MSSSTFCHFTGFLTEMSLVKLRASGPKFKVVPCRFSPPFPER